MTAKINIRQYVLLSLNHENLLSQILNVLQYTGASLSHACDTSLIILETPGNEP